MKIYLDACCWSRPFDEHTQDRIRLEAEAVLSIITRGREGKFTLAASEAIEFELFRIPDFDKFQLNRFAGRQRKFALSATRDDAQDSLGFEPYPVLRVCVKWPTPTAAILILENIQFL
jgi:hypothetical protein